MTNDHMLNLLSHLWWGGGPSKSIGYRFKLNVHR